MQLCLLQFGGACRPLGTAHRVARCRCDSRPLHCRKVRRRGRHDEFTRHHTGLPTGLVTVLCRLLNSIMLVQGDRSDVQAYRRVQAGGGVYCAYQWVGAWLEVDFTVDLPNRIWAGDITYIWTSEGWLYLAAMLDLHSRRVVGWTDSDRMKKYLAIRALDMAVRLCRPPQGCLFHSDRGSQHCSYDYQKLSLLSTVNLDCSGRHCNMYGQMLRRCGTRARHTTG